MCHKWQLFSNKDLKDPEDRDDPRPDPSIQPKARGLLHMEREFITQHIKEDSGLEHLIASTQPGKVLGRLLEVLDEALEDSRSTRKHSMNVFRSTRRLQDSTTKSSEACQTRGHGTAHRHRMFRIEG